MTDSHFAEEGIARMDTPVPVAGVLGATSRIVPRLPDHVPGGRDVAPGLQVGPGGVLLSVPNVARYLVHGGTAIEVEIAEGGDHKAVELFLRGSARAILIYQRGELPLEATTIIDPRGTCIALCGFSGAGKSTLAAVLIDRGARLLADGITRVTLSGGRPLAWPSNTSLALWADACETLHIDTSKLTPVRLDLEKFFVPVPAEHKPLPIAVIVKLRLGSSPDVLDVPKELRSDVIAENIFRKLLIDSLTQAENPARIVEHIASYCRVLTLSGAREHPAEELANCLFEALL